MTVAQHTHQPGDNSLRNCTFRIIWKCALMKKYHEYNKSLQFFALKSEITQLKLDDFMFRSNFRELRKIEVIKRNTI